MDIKLLKEKKLYDSHKRFKKLYEYTFISNDLNEDDDNPDSSGEENDDIMNLPDEPPRQETPNSSNDNDINANGNDLTNNGQETDEVNDGNLDKPELGDTLEDNNEDSDESEDEVIDVDDLTKAQEKSEFKIGEVDNKITQLINMVNTFSNKIAQNDEKIEDLKKEFQLRNPTEVERLNLRSQDSMPFTVSPKDYWEDKSKNSNYKADFNNSVSPNNEKMEYVITNGDISNMNDLKSISDSIDDEDIDLDINKIFGY